MSKATGAFVLAVDHFGKDINAGTRGSVVKEASADVIFATLGERDEEANAVLDLRLKVRKERSAPEGVQYPFEARLVDMGQDAGYMPLTSRVIDWNVERMKREKRKKRTPAQAVLLEAYAHAQKAKVGVNGAEVEAVSENDLQAAFRTLYSRIKPEANSDAIGEARRRALRSMEGEIRHNTIDGTVYWWFPSSPF